MASYPSITRTRRNRLHESTCSPVRSSPCQVAKTGDASISSLVSSASRFFSIHRHILYPSLCIYTCMVMKMDVHHIPTPNTERRVQSRTLLGHPSRRKTEGFSFSSSFHALDSRRKAVPLHGHQPTKTSFSLLFIPLFFRVCRFPPGDKNKNLGTFSVNFRRREIPFFSMQSLVFVVLRDVV